MAQNEPRHRASFTASTSNGAEKPIGEMLLDAGLITKAQLDDGLRRQQDEGGKIVEVLVKQGYLEAHTFVRFLARQPGMASIDLSNYEVPKELIDLVPRELAAKHEVFPVDKLGRLLTVGMVCPLDRATIRELEERTGLRVKPLLCAAADIRNAIRRYYGDAENAGDEAGEFYGGAEKGDYAGLETPLRLASVAHLIRQIRDLPTLPATVRAVRKAMENPSSSMDHVAGVLRRDPPLTAKVLRVANSAAFGFQHQIDNIQHAIALLGLREVYSIAIGTAVVDLFDQSKNFDYQTFWETSYCTATATVVIAQSSEHIEPGGGLFTAGLLHDIGRIALSEVTPDRYARVRASLHGDDLLETEEKVVGITHTEAGYELAQHWDLPHDIAEVIRFHHRPELAEKARYSAAAVCLGSILAYADRDGDPLNESLFVGLESLLETLGLPLNRVDEVISGYLSQKDSITQAGMQ